MRRGAVWVFWQKCYFQGCLKVMRAGGDEREDGIEKEKG